MEHLSAFKRRYLKQLAAVPTFRKCHPSWRDHIAEILGHDVDGQSLYDLGDNLAEIFRVTNRAGRGQNTLSAGGTGWECLVCWYLNLIFWNTPIIVARQNKKFIPDVVNDSLCVTISNVQTNSESDIVVFSVPHAFELGGAALADLNRHLVRHMQSSELCVVQCKTNWNDNAQIPMLWDMIYNSIQFRIRAVSVGRQGVSPSSYKHFSYAFVTVPSNSDGYVAESTAVLRVKGLSGGNYWGRATRPGVAASIKEFPGRLFSSVFEGGIVSHLNRSISEGFLRPSDFIDCVWD
jgi:hypothetical protein